MNKTLVFPLFLRILLDDHFQFWLKKPHGARKRASCREVPIDVTEGPENAQIYGAILGSANLPIL